VGDFRMNILLIIYLIGVLLSFIGMCVSIYEQGLMLEDIPIFLAMLILSWFSVPILADNLIDKYSSDYIIKPKYLRRTK
jgi:hypothetical protein